MKHADHKRFLAWSAVYEKIWDEFGDSAFMGAKYVKQMEAMVRMHVKRMKGSGRITKLIALIKAYHERGKILSLSLIDFSLSFCPIMYFPVAPG